MSLILDALRKSDHQRQRKASERLHAGPEPAILKRNGFVFVLLVTTIIAFTVLVLMLVLRGERGTALPETTTVSAVETVEKKVPVERPRVRALAMERVAPQSTNARTFTRQAPAAARATAEREVPFDAPALAALPPEFRASLPPLHVDVHAWAEEAAERFVLINLKRYAEGDRLEEGPWLRQIRPDGVVLEYQGQVFSLPRR